MLEEKEKQLREEKERRIQNERDLNKKENERRQRDENMKRNTSTIQKHLPPDEKIIHPEKNTSSVPRGTKATASVS